MKISLSVCASLLFVALAACEKSDTPLISVPQVLLDCEIPECNTSIPTSSALVLLSRSGCTNDFDITASSTATFTCSEIGCSGATSGWIDDAEQTVTEIQSGVYDVCVLVDVDGSGPTSRTTNDIIYENSTLIQSSTPVAASGSNWERVD